MCWVHSSLAFIGRILMSLVFLSAGFGKLFDWDSTAHMMTANGLTHVPVLLLGAALIEILGGISLFTGYKVRWGALLLFLFLIPATYFFHDFWNADEANRHLQMIMFLKNLAIMGGLLLVAACGPGCCSLDHCCGKKAHGDSADSHSSHI